MKKHLLLIALISFPLTFIVSQSTNFQKVNSYTYPSFNDIRFVNENTGWVVGVSGSIYQTTDAGQSWHEQRSNSTSSLSSIFFLDDQKGFVGGGNCSLLRTSNGGTTWIVDSITAIPTGTASIGSVYFSDNLKGWILASTSAAGWILSTTDGGISWVVNLTTTKTMNKMSFFEANKGIACGKDAATLYYTSDGINWNLAPTPALGGFNYTRSDMRGIYMVTANEAYVVGWGSTVGAQPSIHLKTTNGGATWNYLTQIESNRTYDNLWNVRFKDVTNGIAIGGASRGSVLVRTSDGGQNWIPIRAPFGSTLNGIEMRGSKLWISGSSGLLIYSPDFGDTWQLLTPMPSGTIYSMSFPSSLIGYAAGFDGVFHKTTDGGQSWRGGFLNVGLSTLNIQSIYFLNENVGYAACSYQMVAKTTDGGANWSAIINDTTSATTTSYGVHFVNENLGFVVGKLGSGLDVIHKTTNGGASWTTKMNITGKDLRAVTFRNETNGIIVGYSLKALYTTDGGENWKVPTFNNLPVGFGTPNMLSVEFISETEALTVGVNFILKSTDSGASWNYIQSGTANQLNSVSAYNSSLGYAVGAKEAWKTTDAGNTWANIYDTNIFEGTLYSSIVDPNGNAWFGGASSGIYTNRVWVGVEDEKDVNINGFELKQNYPNPFNPSTIIKYRLAKSSFVNLDVYDVLGKQVAKLVNDQQSAGNYDLNFTADKLSAGVYFYTLKVDGKVKSKKMILIK
ncbi:MAG: YCF48-related protein [Ignavibacteriaceae bacterium]|nr:YCF48-related protein [Ignavibacteriaceae bacterium]